MQGGWVESCGLLVLHSREWFVILLFLKHIFTYILITALDMNIYIILYYSIDVVMTLLVDLFKWYICARWKIPLIIFVCLIILRNTNFKQGQCISGVFNFHIVEAGHEEIKTQSFNWIYSESGTRSWLYQEDESYSEGNICFYALWLQLVKLKWYQNCTLCIRIYQCLMLYNATNIELTHWPGKDMTVISKVKFSNLFYRMVAWASRWKLLSGECHITSLIISYH